MVKGNYHEKDAISIYIYIYLGEYLENHKTSLVISMVMNQK